MPSLVVCSQKGGVAKTTLALNLSCAFAQRGHRTLLIDADPQGSIGLSLRGSPGGAAGLAEVVRGDAPLSRAAAATRIPGLAILRAGRIAEEERIAGEARLADGRDFCRVLADASGAHDLVVVDTPSGPSGPGVGALRHADFALLPLQAEPLALRSLPRVLDLIGALRENGARVEVAGIVLTMLQTRADGSLDVAQEAWRRLPAELVLETFLPRDPVFLDASARGAPLMLLSRRPPPMAAVFTQMAGELETRMRLGAHDDADEPLSLLG